MFELVTKYKPTGDQPEAIKKLVDNINSGMKRQTLLGATGTGKTFTIANVIKSIGKNTLVLSHNKTLAGQLYSELKALFPNNRVEYFISYYDYYQPEAYVASKDLYIEKDASINDDIDQLRNSAVASLLTSKDVIVVSSVSCIYGIGDPVDYQENILALKSGNSYNRNQLLERLVKMQYERNDYELKRGSFRVKGEIVDIMMSTAKEELVRLEFFDDELEKIKIIDAITTKTKKVLDQVLLYPASLFNVSDAKKEEAIRRIENELKERIQYFKDNNKYLEAERIEQRTRYDLAQKYGHIPTNRELAIYLEMDENLINEATLSNELVKSLDDTLDGERSIYETIGIEETVSIDDMLDIKSSLELLSDAEKAIIKARFYKDMTQSEVAKDLNMTQVMVSRYEKKGLAKMRQYMTL